MGGASIRGAAVAVLLLGAACRGGDDGGDARDDARGDDTGRWRPDVTDTWQWQLQGTVNTGYDVDVYDVDLVETPQDVLDELRDDGRRVVCYFSAGTWETFRDGDPPPDEAIGEPLTGFPDERWPFSYLQVYCDAVVDDDADLVVDVMMAVGGRMSGEALAEDARPFVAAMAEEEQRVVLRCRPYATFAQPPRHLHRNDQEERITHWVSALLPWDTPDPT